mmetsp:Transcript_111083/g.299549  ORF Transcript_111083/g.299549 Transcript_111083/m.299549 type:complete len:247 (-) Transcript_111083:592-1332(-)
MVEDLGPFVTRGQTRECPSGLRDTHGVAHRDLAPDAESFGGLDEQGVVPGVQCRQGPEHIGRIPRSEFVQPGSQSVAALAPAGVVSQPTGSAAAATATTPELRTLVRKAVCITVLLAVCQGIQHVRPICSVHLGGLPHRRGEHIGGRLARSNVAVQLPALRGSGTPLGHRRVIRPWSHHGLLALLVGPEASASTAGSSAREAAVTSAATTPRLRGWAWCSQVVLGTATVERRLPRRLGLGRSNSAV